MVKFKENGKLKLLIIVGTRPVVRQAHHPIIRWFLSPSKEAA